MKFRNPKTGHVVDRFIDMNCELYECESCPIDKISQNNGYHSCTEYVDKTENLIHAASILGYYPVIKTFRERLEREHPECIYINGCGVSGCKGCPVDYGYEKQEPVECSNMTCVECWNRIIPIEETEQKKVKIKEGDIVRLKKEVVTKCRGKYNGIDLSDTKVKKLKNVEFRLKETECNGVWKINCSDIVLLHGTLIGEDAVELVGIDDEKEITEWISVEDKMPEDDLPEDSEKCEIYVLVCTENREASVKKIARTCYNFGKNSLIPVHQRKWYWARESILEPTHWMPLPKVPKKGRANDNK